MSEIRFFDLSGPFTVADIVNWTGARLRPGDDAARTLSNVAPLDDAGANDLAYVGSQKYKDQFAATKAGAVLVPEKLLELAPSSSAILVVEDPQSAFADMVERFFPGSCNPARTFGNDGISSKASIHPSARLENGVTVEPHATIGEDAEIGENTTISAGAVIGRKVRIGRNCSIGPNTSIIHALLGDGVIVHPGARVGQDGFGYISSKAGHRKMPQLGRVVIQDNVEIGANTTIDRGALRDTIIGEGTRVDNLVQIGHNVVVGRHCLIVSQTGISGSVTLGDFVVIGGQVGVAEHLEIGEGTQIAASSNVFCAVPPGQKWGGSPAKPFRDWFREVTVLKNLAANRRKKTPGTDK